MTRVPPIDPPSLTILRPRREPFLEAEIHLVTPMFGGSAEPAASDPDYSVRGSTVRGHLRFWWRACHGSRFTTADELFAAESALWGQAASGSKHDAPSAIDLSVAIVDKGKVIKPEQHNRRPQLSGAYPGYVVFPFQGQAGAQGEQPKPPSDALENVSFTLRFTQAAHIGDGRAAELKQAVEDALWAWVNFGGIGARTRRGCGALYCAPYAPSGNQGDWLRESAALHATHADRTLAIPGLAGSRVTLGGPAHAPLDAWRLAAGWLQEFRQGVGQGRNPGSQPNRPGRSRWPEPDSIRELLDLRDARHRPEHPARPLFPRADLGLPIIFQRMADHGPDPTLEVGADAAARFSSPIIIKPLAVAADRAVPMAVALNAPYLWEVAPHTVKLRQGHHEEVIPAPCCTMLPRAARSLL